mgnify:CR=1 FL=1
MANNISFAPTRKIQIPGFMRLKSFRSAIKFVGKRPARYVLKFNGQLARYLSYIGRFGDGSDVVDILEHYLGIWNKNKKVDFIELTQMCQEYGVFPIAVRGGTEEMQLSALVAGLPALPNQGSSKSSNDDATDKAQESAAPKEEMRPSKIIHRPVRSGQQIYAKGCDLILLGPVSTGAEVLSDGNIHIYAPLRGRALAGIRGNKDTHIFCQQLEAELVSIAGHYKVSDDLQGTHWGQSIHARLDGQHLKISGLTS